MLKYLFNEYSFPHTYQLLCSNLMCLLRVSFLWNSLKQYSHANFCTSPWTLCLCRFKASFLLNTLSQYVHSKFGAPLVGGIKSILRLTGSVWTDLLCLFRLLTFVNNKAAHEPIFSKRIESESLDWIRSNIRTLFNTLVLLIWLLSPAKLGLGWAWQYLAMLISWSLLCRNISNRCLM